MAGDHFQVDLSSQSFMRNPFPVLAQLLQAGPFVRVKLPFIGKVWLATTHETVLEILRDDKTFVRDATNAGKSQAFGLQWWMPRSLRVLARNMLGYDDPHHRRLRKLVDQAFNRQSVEGMHDRIGSLCDGLLDSFNPNQPVHLMEGLARPLPLAVICELLGLPEEDRPNFRKWVKGLMSAASLWGIFGAMPGLFQLMNYFKRRFAQVRKQPRPGLMTALVQAEQDGDRLNEEELLAMAFLLLLAGHETTVHLIGGGILAFLENPEQKARLQADWSLVVPAVEELLRFVCPVQFTKPRLASRDVTFHGHTFRRGEPIMPMLSSANADPARFDHAERMDISRTPNPHVAFGSGVHFCLGAQLVRVEAQVVLERLFTRFPNLTLAVPSSALRYTGRIGLRALTALPVHLL